MKENESYLNLFKGKKSAYSQLGCTRPAVDTLIQDGIAIQQFTLTGDSDVWVPRLVEQEEIRNAYEHARELYLQKRCIFPNWKK